MPEGSEFSKLIVRKKGKLRQIWQNKIRDREPIVFVGILLVSSPGDVAAEDGYHPARVGGLPRGEEVGHPVAAAGALRAADEVPELGLRDLAKLTFSRIQILKNFGGLVLRCIETKCCK